MCCGNLSLSVGVSCHHKHNFKVNEERKVESFIFRSKLLQITGTNSPQILHGLINPASYFTRLDLLVNNVSHV